MWADARPFTKESKSFSAVSWRLQKRLEEVVTASVKCLAWSQESFFSELPSGLLCAARDGTLTLLRSSASECEDTPKYSSTEPRFSVDCESLKSESLSENSLPKETSCSESTQVTWKPVWMGKVQGESSTDSDTSASTTLTDHLAVIDQKFAVLLGEWQHAPDVVLAIHPEDGSLIVWYVHGLDLSVPNPNGIQTQHVRLVEEFGGRSNVESVFINTPNLGTQYSQVTASLRSRLHEAFPLSEAQSIVPGGLFFYLTSAPMNRHQLQLARVGPHESHSELILWSVGPVGPLTRSASGGPSAELLCSRCDHNNEKHEPVSPVPPMDSMEATVTDLFTHGGCSFQGGLSEVARIDVSHSSKAHTWFDDLAWFPCLLTTSLTPYPVALFVGSVTSELDGTEQLGCFLALADAGSSVCQKTSSVVRPMDFASSDTAGFLVHLRVVLPHSSRCSPPMSNEKATSLSPETLLFHIFPRELIPGAKAEDEIEVLKSGKKSSSYFIVRLTRWDLKSTECSTKEIGTCQLEMWRIRVIEADFILDSEVDSQSCPTQLTSFDNLLDVEKTMPSIQLDWVSTEDGGHLLSVMIGSRVVVYAPTCQIISYGSGHHQFQSTLMTTLGEVYLSWTRVASAKVHISGGVSSELKSIEGHPTMNLDVLHTSKQHGSRHRNAVWLRDGLLLVGAQAEMYVYSQWPNTKSAQSVEGADATDDSAVSGTAMETNTPVTTNVDQARSTSVENHSNKCAIPTQVGSSSETLNQPLLNNLGLFESIQSSLGPDVPGTNSSSGAPGLSTGNNNRVTVNPNNTLEAPTIPPLPLYVLLAVDELRSSDLMQDTSERDTAFDPMDDLISKTPTDEANLFKIQEDDAKTDLSDEAFHDSDEPLSSHRKRSEMNRTKGSAAEQAGLSMWSLKPNSLAAMSRFLPEDARLLTEFLATHQLPGLSPLDQMYLLGIADLMANTHTETTERLAGMQSAAMDVCVRRLDECGLRFLLTVQLYSYLSRTLPPARRAQLLIARTAFQTTKDPMEAVVFYLAMHKAKMVAGLFKTIGNKTLENFFRSDFEPGLPACRQAKLNAFRLLSQHRYAQAAGLFLLAGCLDDAIRVCLDTLKDLQLAVVLVRLYTSTTPGLDNRAPDSPYPQLLRKHVVTHEDPFLRSMAYWTLGDPLAALQTLLEGPMLSISDNQKLDPSVSSEQLPGRISIQSPQHPQLLERNTSLAGQSTLATGLAYHSVYPSVFKFYTYLRSHPLVLRQWRLNAPTSADTLALRRLTSLERRLYFRTAHHYSALGCPTLALEVLTKLPPLIGDDHFDRRGSVFDQSRPSRTSIASQPTSPSKNRPSETDVPDDLFAWSTQDPFVTTVRNESEQFKIEWSDEDEPDSQNKLIAAPRDNRGPTQISSPNDSRQSEPVDPDTLNSDEIVVDLIANQLKFIACLKILAEELSTLAAGAEVSGSLFAFFISIPILHLAKY
ncbi:unnamed protein product [Echinostoma caproni]|uniref:Rav1p_C domain-containing protein n=1 Tax=Echinostoma caproni TaxID=27848 RepID=A0A183A9L2_9TREM|nr:unnamed protein product [Echinostoma caproni]